MSGDARNKAEDLKGRAKEAMGDVSGNEDLEREGRNDQRSASVRDKVDTARDKVDEAIDKVKDRLNR